jgi:hypothetical protein
MSYATPTMRAHQQEEEDAMVDFGGNHASRKTRTTTPGDWKTLMAHVQCPKVEKKENAKANGGVYIEACKWLCKCGEKEGMSCSSLKILFVTHVPVKERNNIVKVSSTMCASKKSVEVEVNNIGDPVGVFWAILKEKAFNIPNTISLWHIEEANQ